MANKKIKITRETKINELIMQKPEAAELLFEAGMSCVGCPMSAGESIEAGCSAHGISEKQIDELIKKLNK